MGDSQCRQPAQVATRPPVRLPSRHRPPLARFEARQVDRARVPEGDAGRERGEQLPLEVGAWINWIGNTAKQQPIARYQVAHALAAGRARVALEEYQRLGAHRGQAGRRGASSQAPDTRG